MAGTTPVYGFPYPEADDVVDHGVIDALDAAVQAQINALGARCAGGLVRPSVQVRVESGFPMGGSGTSNYPLFITELWDTDSMWSLAARDRIIVNTPGLWLFWGYMGWVQPAGGTVAMTATQLEISPASERIGVTKPGRCQHNSVVGLWNAQAGDFVRLYVSWVGSGAAAQTGDRAVLGGQLLVPAP